MARPIFLKSPHYGRFNVIGETHTDWLVNPTAGENGHTWITKVHKTLVPSEVWEPVYPATPVREQVGGNHYSKHEIQPWDIVDEYELDYYLGNVLKYILRDKSNRLEDLQKAAHFLEKRIELEKNRVSS